MSPRLKVIAASFLFLALTLIPPVPALAGLNAGGVARLRWVGTGGLGDSNRASFGGRPKLVVTVQGVSSFQGADVQILASAVDGNALPDAWLGNGTGGCNDGNFTFALGGSGVAYPNIFNTAPAVGPVVASQNGESYNQGGCANPPGLGLFWLSAAGPAGKARNPAVEYAVWSVAFDLRGVAQGGPVDCSGDLSDPAGTRPILLTSNFRIPCNGPHQGLGIEVLDANLQTDFLPFVDGTGLLGWETDSIPTHPDLTPPVVTVVHPNGGEVIATGSLDTLIVTATDNVGPDRMDADLSLDGGANYNISLGHNVPYSPTLLWSVPASPTSQARVRVTVRDRAGNSGSDESDTNFTIRTNVPPGVSVIFPRGGEVLAAGSSVNITLSPNGVQAGARMDLAYSLDGGATFGLVIALDVPFATSLLWDTPWVVSTSVRVRAVVRNPDGLTGQGISAANFSLVDRVAPFAHVFSPNGGEVIAGGSPFTAHFSASDNLGGALLMSLRYSTDGGATFPGIIASGVPYADAFIWNVPVVATTHARLKLTVADSSGNTGSDASDADFTIQVAPPPDTLPPFVTVLAPNGGETYVPGAHARLRTSAGDDRGVVSMDAAMSSDGGASYPYVFADHAAYQDSLPWVVPGVEGTQNKFRVTVRDAAGHTATDFSDGLFTIHTPPDTLPPSVTLLVPNGGESYVVDAHLRLRTVASDDRGVVSMDAAMSSDGGATYPYVFADHSAYQDSLPWIVPNVPGTQNKFKVTVRDAAGNAATDVSKGVFTIHTLFQDTIPPQVTILSPNGGESYPVSGTGNMQSLASDNIGLTTMDLALSTNSGASYDYPLLLHMPYQASVNWPVPPVATTHARLRVTVYDGVGNSSSDASDADFSLVGSSGGGANQGATAHAYWIVPGDSASPSRRSDSGQPRLLVTVKGIHNFRGADVQLILTAGDGGRLPDAWQGNPGGCNDGNFTYGLGAVGTRYPSAFNSAPAVPGMVASQDGEVFETGDCRTTHGTGLFWLSVAGAAGEPRDPAKEYALWNIRFDFRGTAHGGPTDCPGDLGDPSGPRGVVISPNFRIPCNGPQPGAVLAVLDDNLNLDYLPFVLGNAALGWEANPSAGLSPVLVADLEAHRVGGGIELSWSVVNPSEVRSIEILRQDGGAGAFNLVANLPAVEGDMRYADATALASQDHDYELVLHGSGGESATIHYKFAGIAESFRLAAPVPNPSRRSVAIRYSMDRAAPMALDVLDVRGTRIRLVQQGASQAGEHSVEWDGRDSNGRSVPLGVYFLRLSSGGKSTVRRVVRL